MNPNYNSMYNFTSDEKGFSLVEIIVVVSIVGILAGISAPSFLNWRRHQIMTDATNEISGDLRSVVMMQGDGVHLVRLS